MQIQDIPLQQGQIQRTSTQIHTIHPHTRSTHTRLIHCKNTVHDTIHQPQSRIPKNNTGHTQHIYPLRRKKRKYKYTR